MKVYVHAGFSKTGSSALQSYLSFNNEHWLPNKKKLVYCSISPDGELLYGDRLREIASQSPLKYVASDPAAAERCDESHSNLFAGNEFVDKIKRQLKRLDEAGLIPLLSQEDWGLQGAVFRRVGFFNKLGCRAHVIVYVRPQVSWCNSAWWQWYAWDKQIGKPSDGIERWGVGFMLWAEKIKQWRDVEGVDAVTVRLHPEDVVSDFMSLFDIKPGNIHKGVGRLNVSLSPLLIKALKTFPGLRGIHDSHVDVILSKYLPFEGKAPSVIDLALTKYIIQATQNDNLELSDMLDEPSRKRMLEDPLWWDPCAYPSDGLWDDDVSELTKEELKMVLEKALIALLELGKRS